MLGNWQIIFRYNILKKTTGVGAAKKSSRHQNSFYLDLQNMLHILQFTEQQFGDCFEASVYCLQTDYFKMVLRILCTSEKVKTFGFCKIYFEWMTLFSRKLC